MADPRILSRIIQLGKELGANISNSIGTKSNVNFLGSGPKDGMLFQKDINPESFLAIGTQKVLPDIEASIGYASGNKLDGFQLQQLEKNLITMKESLSPTNVVDMGTGGIDSLRAKSGLGERQATDAVDPNSEIGRSLRMESEGKKLADSMSESEIELRGNFPKATDVEIKNMLSNESPAFPSFKTTENIDSSSPLMSKLESRVEGMKDNVGSPFDDYRKNVLQEGGEEVTGIMKSVAKGDLPAKTGAAREFLINTLKVGDDYPSTTLTDVMSAEDMKYVFEGGGGAMGDPLVLVQKYFGPRIAEMIPNGGSSEEIAIFTKRVMDNVEDARGFKPDEPGFDNMTAKFVDELSEGTYSFGYKKGGEFQNNVNSMGKGTLKEIIDSGELLGDDLQAALNALRSRKANGGRAGYAQGGLAKILEL